MARNSALSSSLRRRLAWTLTAVILASALLQALGFWLTKGWIEHENIDVLVEREIDFRLHAKDSAAVRPAKHLQPGEPGPALLYYPSSRDPMLPPVLRSLPAGWHRDLDIDSRTFHVLVRDRDNADRAFLMHEVIAVDGSRRLIASFVLGLTLVALLAMWLVRRLGRQVASPLARLLDQIRSLDPENRGMRVRPEGDPELDVIAAAMNGYMTELDALIERERAFAAAASHELRTPLAVIGGAAELLQSGPKDPSRPLARIRRAVAQAEQDLDALLALSRVRESQRTWMLDLEQLLPEWAEMYAGSTCLIWQLQPVLLSAAPGSIHVIFSNLLRNAVRAAGPDGTVTISLDEQALRVSDTGPGVPIHELPMVFEPHFRGRDGGTGIGLYVAQAMARRHGWLLSLANGEEGGAVAVLMFKPLDPAWPIPTLP